MVKTCVSRFLVIFFVLFQLFNCRVYAWDNEDFELFDLVEEIGVNNNFYDVYELPKDASNLDIRKAYRRLSLKFHPDHNKDENAEQQFRQIVSIYDVLRDDVKRKKYDHVLEVGLPDWRHPAYYYRKVRKVGLLELAGILFVILTLGQWIVSWAIYLERKFEMEEVLTSRLKKRDKKKKKGKQGGPDDTDEIIAEELSLIGKPQFRDLLPFIVGRGFVSAVLNIPQCYLSAVEFLRDRAKRRAEAATAALTDDVDGLGGGEDDADPRKPRRKHVYELPEGQEVSFVAAPENTSASQLFESPGQTSSAEDRAWTEEDVASLTKAMTKYPVGCAGRWDRIAELLHRSAQDVAAKAKCLKSSTAPKAVSASLQGLTADKLSHLTVQVDRLSQRDSGETGEGDPTTTAAGVKLNSDDGWSQVLQKTLELALVQFPRGTEERWEKIAQCIPGKTKEECMARFKLLAELVKKRRQNNPK